MFLRSLWCQHHYAANNLNNLHLLVVIRTCIMRWQAGGLHSRYRQIWGGLLFWSVVHAPGGSLSMCFGRHCYQQIRSDQIRSVWASPAPRASTCGIGIIHTLLDARRFEQSGRSCQRTSVELHARGGCTGYQRMTRLALVTTEDNVGCEYYEIIVLILQFLLGSLSA